MRSIYLSGTTLAFLAPDGVYKVTGLGKEEAFAPLSGARDVLITETGSVAAVYTDSARIVSFEDTGE